MKVTRLIAALSLSMSLLPALAAAQDKLPLPRFVSLRSDEVNLRLGPGSQYPVDWVFRRARLPVEIVAEFDTWRKIRDSEGTEGWVHQTMVTGRRTVQITGQMRVLRRKPEAESPAVARVEPGVVGELTECQGQWCRIDVQGRRGWLPRTDFFGVYPGETVK
jgi:SH3-like domain-containing protein